MEHPNHPFHAILILNHKILPVLKNEHLTLEPSPRVPIATGVLPHVAHSRDIKEVKVLCTETKEANTDFRVDLKAEVSNAVNAKVRADGGVNQSVLQKSCSRGCKTLQSSLATLHPHQKAMLCQSTL